MSNRISLLEIPELALTKILEKCDFVAILILRKTCHDLRNFIDDTKPNQLMTRIIVQGRCDSVELTCEALNSGLYPKSQEIYIKYQKEQEGCKIVWKKCEKERYEIFNDEKVSEVFARDFQAILNLRLSVLKEFNLYGSFQSELMKRIAQCLKCDPVRAKKIVICENNQSQIMELLPSFHAVEEIIIYNEYNPDLEYELLEMDQIVKLDQWKQAKKFVCYSFYVSVPIQSFAHFNHISIRFRELSADSLKFLKEVFFNSISISKCFEFWPEIDPYDALIEMFGEPCEVDTMAIMISWFIWENPDYVLAITVGLTCLTFNNIRSSDVPEGARIIDRI